MWGRDVPLTPPSGLLVGSCVAPTSRGPPALGRARQQRLGQAGRQLLVADGVLSTVLPAASRSPPQQREHRRLLAEMLVGGQQSSFVPLCAAAASGVQGRQRQQQQQTQQPQLQHQQPRQRWLPQQARAQPTLAPTCTPALLPAQRGALQRGALQAAVTGLLDHAGPGTMPGTMRRVSPPSPARSTEQPVGRAALGNVPPARRAAHRSSAVAAPAGDHLPDYPPAAGAAAGGRVARGRVSPQRAQATFAEAPQLGISGHARVGSDTLPPRDPVVRPRPRRRPAPLLERLHARVPVVAVVCGPPPPHLRARERGTTPDAWNVNREAATADWGLWGALR
jgi:hypothetical protein